MSIDYGNYVDSEIPNTTKREMLKDGVVYVYEISPKEGYLLHDSRSDVEEIDFETMKTNTKLGYKSGSTTVPANYDFNNKVSGVDNNTPVEKIGVYKLYTVQETPEEVEVDV